MKTEPMALATGVDAATICQIAPEATAQAKYPFHQATHGQCWEAITVEESSAKGLAQPPQVDFREFFSGYVEMGVAAIRS
jgi:hypothetical protein